MWVFRPQHLLSMPAVVLCLLGSGASLAAPPVVKTVPADANNAIIPHEIVSGRPTTLKGTVDEASAGAAYSWDPGDGSAAYEGTVTDPYAVWVEHTYDAPLGTVFIATLTVDNGTDAPESGTYRMQVGEGLSAEVNAAITEALWFMHRTQQRFVGDAVGVADNGDIPMGYWLYSHETSGSVTVSVTGSTINAFEANGYRETGPASSPYTDTVSRGLQYLFARLQAIPIDNQTFGSLDANPRDDDPDGNGNGLGITLDNRNLNNVTVIDPPYQLGMIMDAIVATGTPGALAAAGPDDVLGRSYGDIVQDMVDWYSWAQSDSPQHGGWQYNAFDDNTGSHDNSASGWAGTGIGAAKDVFNATVPDWMIERNENGLEFTDNEFDDSDRDGIHGYTNSPNELWGPYSVTGAALVQMVMDDIESTTAATPDERWVRSENFFRRNFNAAASTSDFKNYYYAMFNFAKAMRTAKPSQVVEIGTVVGAAEGGVGCGPNAACAADGPNPLDWYNDPTDGLAATVVGYQRTSGDLIGSFEPKNFSSSQYRHNTPWATQILTRTLLQAGPIARARAAPNPGGPGFRTTFDPSQSFHQDPEREITTYAWDFSDALQADTVADPDACEVLDGTDPPPVVSPCVTDEPFLVRKPDGFICPEGEEECSQVIGLTVTDDGDPPLTSSTTVTLDLTLPPHAPTSVPGGPYVVCAGGEVTLDGSQSFDLDEGLSEPDATDTDRITKWEWDVDGNPNFTPDDPDDPDFNLLLDEVVTVTFDTPAIVDIGLRVTDNSALAYPSAFTPPMDLTGSGFTTVNVVDCFVADVSTSISVDDDQPQVGDSFNANVDVSNAGPDEATGIKVFGFIPDNVSITSLDVTGGACQIVEREGGQGVECDLDAIAAGATAEVALVLGAEGEGQTPIAFQVEGPDEWLDPDDSNQAASVVVDIIDEIILAIKSTGKGGGSAGLVELLLLTFGILGLLIVRRRRLAASVGACLLAASLALPVTSEAGETLGLYGGFGYGNASVDFDKGDLTQGMANRGYTITDVSADDDDEGYKVYLGYLINEYFGIEAAYVDLGELESSFTASVPPDEVDDLLAAADDVQPGLGEGWLLSGLAQYPFNDWFAVYGTLGVFMAEPESKATVVSGGTSGSSSSDDDEANLAWGIGAKFMFGDGRWAIRGAFERYDVDEDVDYLNVSIEYKFGWPK